jgi:membrane-associated PAP2 superfamily phosphatase
MLSTSTALTAGIVLLAVGFVAYGGTFVLRVVTKRAPPNELQTSFFRAGHAHAGVLIILGLVVELYVDLAGVDGIWQTLAGGVLWSAILMPAGFFLSVTGKDPERPNRMFVLLWLGAACLVVGLVSAAIGLIGVATG